MSREVRRDHLVDRAAQRILGRCLPRELHDKVASLIWKAPTFHMAIPSATNVLLRFDAGSTRRILGGITIFLFAGARRLAVNSPHQLHPVAGDAKVVTDEPAGAFVAGILRSGNAACGAPRLFISLTDLGADVDLRNAPLDCC